MHTAPGWTLAVFRRHQQELILLDISDDCTEELQNKKFMILLELISYRGPHANAEDVSQTESDFYVMIRKLQSDTIKSNSSLNRQNSLRRFLFFVFFSRQEWISEEFSSVIKKTKSSRKTYVNLQIST